MQHFRNKVVVITGASAGVGRATAHRFARAGARLGLIARDADALNDVKHEVEARGGVAIVLPLDVADAEAMFAAAQRVENELGPIDVWVNDAMVTVFSRIWDMTPEEFRRVTEVTYLGYVHGSMAALRHMRPRNRGVIVQVGSALAYRAIPLQSAYCGAKHAIKGFTEALRTELRHDGIGVAVTMVNLPAVNTPQFDWARTHLPRNVRPAGKIYEPEVAAEAIVHAARHYAREYWLGASTAIAILGNAIAPEVADSYLAANAVDGQMTGKRSAPGRPDNLFTPVHALHRTRGSFTSRAHDSAIRLPGPLARVGAAALGLGVAAAVGMATRLALPRR